MDVKSNGRVTEFNGAFQEGVNRTPKPAPGDNSQVTSGYKPSPSEPTALPIQKGQIDVHYDEASSRPVIPPSQNTELTQSLKPV